MTEENSGAQRTQPLRIVHMSIADDPGRRPRDAPLVIMAEFEHGPDTAEEVQWWTEQLRDRVNVRSWGGTRPGRWTSVHVEAPADEIEAVARRLLTAVDDANSAYLESYPAWRRERNERIAEERLREQRLSAAQQATLDQVMGDHRSPG
jgi:hypothetical protein